MKNNEEKYCKVCGNIMANPDSKTYICPRCSEKGVKGAGILAIITPAIIKVGKLVSKTIKNLKSSSK